MYVNALMLLNEKEIVLLHQKHQAKQVQDITLVGNDSDQPN